MKERISRSDIEALSAYLDGELSVRDRARLEARLQVDSILRTTLVSLRQTRTVLRNTPHLRAPRNFTLSPELANKQVHSGPLNIFSALRLSSVLATILFIMVVLGDYFTSGRHATPANVALERVQSLNATEAPAAAMQPPPAPAEPITKTSALNATSEKAVPAAQVPLQTLAVVPTEYWPSNGLPGGNSGTAAAPLSPPVAGEGGGMGGGAPSVVKTQNPPIPTATLSSPLASPPAVRLLAPTATGVNPENVSPTNVAADQTYDQQVASITPSAVLKTQETVPGETALPAPPQRTIPSGKLVMEIILAVIALGSGGAAILFRTKRNP